MKPIRIQTCFRRDLMLLIAALHGCILIASATAQPVGQPATSPMRVRLSAQAGGARYKPASPVQRQGPFQSPDQPAPPADREPASRTDQVQRIGAIITAAHGRVLFYDLDAGLYVNQGERQFERVTTENGRPARSLDSTTPESVSVLPGDRLRLGVRFCEDICELSLGRNILKSSLNDAITGGHGSLTGVHLNFTHPGYGSVHIAPLYRPELTGTYLPPDEDLPGMQRRLRTDFLTVARKPLSYGHRVAYSGNFGPLYVGLDYALHRQTNTANPITPAETAAPRFGRAGRFNQIDQIEYTGVGFGFATESAYAVVHVERSAGRYRTLLSVPAATDETRNSESAADRSANIAGSALLTSAGIQSGGLQLSASFYLPEPRSRRDPGETAGVTSSGYVGFGDTPLQAPILSGVLDFRPAPEFCPAPGACEGLAIRNFASDAPIYDSEVDVLETNFRDHAAVFVARAEYTAENFSPAMTLTIFAPLAPRAAGGRTPFQKIKKDARSYEYREFEISCRWRIAGEGFVFARYSRLYRRHPAAGSQLAGESLWLAMQYEY